VILVTRFNGTEFYINADMILSVEGTPDTVITLTNNSKLVVKEKADLIVDRIIAYQQKIKNPKIKVKAGE
jgi:flagellar protein FlbD